jgi:hypothetical protein
MTQARRWFCRIQLDLGMGAIDTEDAARRLARVILSDIDLYIRERPKLGESREAQIEEGRRLFASRVTPALVPLFGMVLADRDAGRVNAPAAVPAPPIPANGAAVPAPSIPANRAAAPAPPIPASGAAATDGPVHSPPVAAIEDEPATEPSIFVPPLEDRTPPAPAIAARAAVHPPRAPAASRLAIEARPKPAPPIAPEIPTPVLTPRVPSARISIPTLLAIVSVVAAIVAVVRLLFR